MKPVRVSKQKSTAEGPGHEGSVREGQWYWYKPNLKPVDDDVNDDVDGDEFFGCVSKIGSNYVELTFLGNSSVRVHFDRFAETCRQELDPDTVIATSIAAHRTAIKELMAQIEEIYKKLGISNDPSLTPGSESGLVVVSGTKNAKAFETALLKAKREDLPQLFKQIEEEHRNMARWLEIKTAPLRSEVNHMKKVMGKIDGQLLNVSLYAGLVENTVEIQQGDPASLGTKLHLLQRMHFIDEECLLDYNSGGMNFQKVEEFDQWLLRPRNLERILPHPRCVVAFRIRRDGKDYGELNPFVAMRMRELDEQTLLYIRNGSRVFRLTTGIKFGETLFPDRERSRLSTTTKLWVGHSDKLICDDEYQELMELRRKYDAEDLEDDRNGVEYRDSRRYKRNHDIDLYTSYKPFDNTNVMYDDIIESIKRDVEHNNRIALVLQGLYDRSDVFHPHAPSRLWDPVVFDREIELVFDVSRALTDGEKPDFQAYFNRLNALIAKGSFTIGQRSAWVDKCWISDRTGYRYPPYGDDGPGHIACVESMSRDRMKATFRWTRQRRGRISDYDLYYKKKSYKDELPAVVTCRTNKLFNVSAYTPGDYLMFYSDPRTRADYLKWAPMLLEAERWHAERNGLIVRHKTKSGSDVFLPAGEEFIDPDLDDDDDDDENDGSVNDAQDELSSEDDNVNDEDPMLCAYCGATYDIELTCPTCSREGCHVCMPAGNGCPCPDCEDADDEQDDASQTEPPTADPEPTKKVAATKKKSTKKTRGRRSK